MIHWAAKLLVRMGAALLFLSLIIRPAIHTANGLMGDNLAIIACVILVGIALLYLKFGPKDADQDKQSAARPRKRVAHKHS
ncbi:MAG TPA: hypothetical protein VIP98_05120 [Microlunatus sp.]